MAIYNDEMSDSTRALREAMRLRTNAYDNLEAATQDYREDPSPRTERRRDVAQEKYAAAVDAYDDLWSEIEQTRPRS